ncbi:MAG: hotdog fold thioesterase [Bacteroidetes bacterium]|nr:hotdog fold thioesterase [Bacteroidota bacterium]
MLEPIDIFHLMFDNDPFSRWMGMALVSIEKGSCTLRMQVRPEMLNGFGVAHGAITFALADSAFAFACNTSGYQSVSIHCTIEHVAPVEAGDWLEAIAIEERAGNRISNYSIRIIRSGDGAPVAFFRGICFHKNQNWTK